MRRSAILVAIVLLIAAGVHTAESAHATLEAPSVAVAISSAQEDQPEGKHKDVPWVPIVVLAFVVPIAVLVVPSFFMRRGSSGH